MEEFENLSYESIDLNEHQIRNLLYEKKYTYDELFDLVINSLVNQNYLKTELNEALGNLDYYKDYLFYEDSI